MFGCGGYILKTSGAPPAGALVEEAFQGTIRAGIGTSCQRQVEGGEAMVLPVEDHSFAIWFPFIPQHVAKHALMLLHWLVLVLWADSNRWCYTVTL